MYRNKLYLYECEMEQIMSNFISLCRCPYYIRQGHLKDVIKQLHFSNGRASRKMTCYTFAFFKLLEQRFGWFHVHTLNPFEQNERIKRDEFRRKKITKSAPRAMVYIDLITSESKLSPEHHLSCLYRKKFLCFQKKRVEWFNSFSGVPKDVVRIIFQMVDKFNEEIETLRLSQPKTFYHSQTLRYHQSLLLNALNKNKIVYT